ncbi:MAG: SusC/RagA family TonB-linked outer membrane protein [Bacteroidales bacterium]
MRKILVSLVFLLFAGLQVAFSQRTVTGTVTSSADNSILPGVSVLLKGTTTGIVADGNGKYSIEVPGNQSILQFSFIGYARQEVVVGSQTVIDVALAESMLQMDEVVVTALGIKRQTKALSYAAAEVKGNDIQKVPELNLMNSLQGKIAGVDINMSGTGAAGSSRVTIRGNTSISRDNNPLYVIDGVPITRASSSIGGRDLGDALTTLNPNDIETMSVLKGAAATALYGSRASNGVILITTKSGTRQQGVGISYNGTFGFENYVNPFRGRQKLYGNSGSNGDNSDVYQTTWNQEVHRNWGPRYDGKDLGIFFNDNPDIPLKYSYIEDHWDNFMRTGSTITNDVSFNGGSENQKFRVSFSDMRYSSPVPNSDMNRQTVNINANSKFGKRITLEARANYSTSQSKNRPNPARYIQMLSIIPTSWDINWLKGETEKWGAKPDGWMLPFSTNDYYQNPYWSAYQDAQNDQRERISASANVRYDFTSWLFATGRIGTETSTVKVTNIDAYGFLRGNVAGTGSVEEYTAIDNQLNADYSLVFNKSFGLFNVNAMFGGSVTRSKYNRDGIRGDQLLIPFYHVITNAGQLYNSVSNSQSGINSLYGSAEISFKDLIYLTATGRNDWFSTLAAANNSIFYPSIGLSYLFSNQFKLPEWWTFAKLRASYAEVGGGSSPYSTKIGYNFDATGYMNTPLLSLPGSIANPNLQPYETREYEVGFDFRFFKSRIGLDYAYYDKKTTNDIVGVTLPSSSGYGSATVNLGAISNKGHEIMLTLVPVAGKVNWEISMAYAHNVGEILDLGGVSEVSAGSVGIGGGIDVKQIVGSRPYAIFGYTQKQVNGEPVWDRWTFNYNGQAHQSWRPARDAQKTLLGYGTHPNTGSLTSTVTWKGFSLTAQIDGKWGAKVAFEAEQEMIERGQSIQTLPGREGGLFLDGVYNSAGSGDAPVYESLASADGYTINANPSANLPSDVPVAGNEIPYHVKHFENYYREGFTKRVSEMVVFDASYAKFRQLTFGYNVPRSMLKNLPVQNVNVSLVGRNLFDIYNKLPNGDPSTGGAIGINNRALPASRSFTLNLNVNF